jgi:hypothetical protein
LGFGATNRWIDLDIYECLYGAVEDRAFAEAFTKVVGTSPPGEDEIAALVADDDTTAERVYEAAVELIPAVVRDDPDASAIWMEDVGLAVNFWFLRESEVERSTDDPETWTHRQETEVVFENGRARRVPWEPKPYRI